MVSTKVLIGCLVMCTILLVLSVITSIILVFRKNRNSTGCETNQKAKCETFACVKAAAQIVDYIDEKFNPCEDFYQFANGRYLREKTEEETESHNLFDTVSDAMNRKIGPLLRKSPHRDEPRPLRMAKTFYQSCNNWNQYYISDEQKTEILKTLGGWPVVQGKSWLDSKFHLSDLLIKVKNLGFGTDFLLKVFIYEDPKNKTKKWLAIDEGSYENVEDKEDYQQLMNRLPLDFLSKTDKATKARIAAEWKNVSEFENQLRFHSDNKQENAVDLDDEEYDADVGDDEDEENEEVEERDEENGDNNAADYDDDNFNINDKITTIKKLQESFPWLNWLKYFNGILPSGMSVTENEPIVNFKPEFLQNYRKIYKSKRTVANYIIWRVFYKIHQLEMEETDPNGCIGVTSEKFTIPVTILYSLKYFNEESRREAVALVEDVRHTFIDMLRGVTWMDSATRTRAIEKAEHIVAHVGYANGMHELNDLNEYYSALDLKTDDFFYNSIQWNLFNQNQNLKMLRKPTNRSGLETIIQLQPNEANAFYTPSDNTIQFPISILHELFFAVDRPRFINYASFGSIVGHEITHGFDNEGRKYDLNGSLMNWWDAQSMSKFVEKSECFVEQYNSYEDKTTELKVNGKKTLGENIADHGGTRAAYYAYQNWIKRNRREELVPVKKYNPKQLFWISFAQSRSGVSAEEYLREQIKNDEHAPDEFRVNGVVSNMPEFAADFNCTVGSKMNPKKKCKIW